MTDEIPVSKVLLRNDGGEFLVVQEKESGRWELPGGKIERREGRYEAAKREVREEVNLRIRGLEEVVRVEIEDEECVNCWILYAEDFSGSIELYEEELSDFNWVSASKFREMDWHADAGYAIPAMRFLEEYLA